MQQKQINSSFLSAIAGGSAGIAVDIVYFPLETIKTRIQASRTNKVDFTKIAKHLSKYRGFSLQMLSSFPFAFTFFGSYDYFKKILEINFSNLNGTQLNFVSAALAEIIGDLIRSPFEVIKQQQQVGWDNKVRQTITAIYKLNGYKAFYRGFFPLIFRDIPFSGIQLSIYEYLKQGKRHLEMKESCLYGSISAGTAAFITTPMDVIKSKIMTQRDAYYKSLSDCFKKIVKEEGVRGLWKGTQYRTFPLMFTGTIFFTVYEQIKHILSDRDLTNINL